MPVTGGFSVVVSMNGLAETVRGINNLKRDIRRGAKEELKVEGDALIQAIIRKFFSGRPGLIQRSGALAASFKSRTTGRIDGTVPLGLEITSNSKYLDTHRFGRVISAKNKLMPVPLPFTGVFTPEGASGAGFKIYGSLRGFRSKLVSIKSRDGRMYLINKLLRRVTHRLMQTVYVPPRVQWITFVRSYLNETMVPSLQTKIDAISAKIMVSSLLTIRSRG